MDTGYGSGRQEELPEEVSLRDVYVQPNDLQNVLNQNLDALEIVKGGFWCKLPLFYRSSQTPSS